MAQFICSRYIPTEELIVTGQDINSEDFLKEGYKVSYVSTRGKKFYELVKPPVLEMVFREGERDYVFNMIKEARSFFGKDTISNTEANQFAVLIVYGEIKVTILPDGSYTLK